MAFIIRNYVGMKGPQITAAPRIPVKNLGWLFRRLRIEGPRTFIYWRKGNISKGSDYISVVFPSGPYFQSEFASEEVFREVFARQRSMKNVSVDFIDTLTAKTEILRRSK